jgi:NADPH:quinone reductase-like Zn-dependent oxidoreductase
VRALVCERYGPPHEVVRLVDLPRPTPGPGEVLVRVRAASINSWDWDLLTGTSLGRLGAPFRPRRRVLGADIAGTVEAVGEGVTAFVPGDPVFGDLSEGKWGGFAEYAVGGADELAHIPSGLSFVKAAAIPQAGALAMQALRSRSDLGPHSDVLINGAGGGVGTFAVQMAAALGARVTGVDHEVKDERVHSLGASRFIDYQRSDFTAEGTQYDLIVDMVAQHSPSRYARALKEGGRLVMVGGRVAALLRIAALGRIVGRKQGQHMGLLFYRPSATDNLELARRCVAGKLEPIIDTLWPLEDGARALARLGSGLAIGKVVIGMAD